ncbi:MAG: MotA/TolQ/ExbB proton channel family protein [Clostridiales Family XIII bacterium]|jgi:biopolymer transport protein ExbB/TolQ|nr:MotA/TolQ/ExbB proton channel family protein [Clostridiales Family XIII bacterium]
MFTGENLSHILRAVATALQTPVIAILLLLMAATVFLLGSLVVEAFTERAYLRAKLPAFADALREGGATEAAIENSGLPARQRRILSELTLHPGLSPAMRESLAVRLVAAERARCEGIVRVSDLIARLGPIFGLLGTLIPLGPGIIALGRGDTHTLSLSLLMAFDTTIAGLISAAVAFVISAVRKRWYASYMASLEMAAECVLETLNEKAL